ncbi:MAG TPA: helix-turn-helix transcriptional regulator [Rectinemataceae bacterium]|nr:helix-turn-helix transcriptional regulator [Rectinemataceae bacterium]
MTELHRSLVFNIKRLRTHLAISQMELAERAGISPGYVGEIEMGRKFPTPEVLERLAQALEVRPFRLLMSPDDVADSAGLDAAYDTASRLRARVERDMADFMRDLGPGNPDRS